MGTTWGDLRTWGQLDLWWIPNAIQGAPSVTAAAASSAGGSGITTGATTGHVATESFASADRIAIAHAGNVVECATSAEATVVSTETADAALEITASATASAVRIPPADVPAGALVGRIRS